MQPAPSPNWQLEGSSAAGYERYLVPIIFAPWAERLLDLAAPEPGERVLDVGCGTGIVARRAAPRVGTAGTVVALDPNQGMLAVARTVAAGIRPAIAWHQGSAADLPLPDQAFDVVCCQQVLQFVPDPALALREMHRVLVPDGRLALGVWRSLAHSPGFVALATALARHAGADAGAIMRSPFPSWDAADLRDLAAGAGFRAVCLRIGVGSVRFPSPEDFVRQEAASSPLAGPLGALGAAAREALIRDLGERLRASLDDSGIVFPMETYLVVARR